MATQKEAGKKYDQMSHVEVKQEAMKIDPVEAAIKRAADAQAALHAARIMERTARSSGDAEALDDAIYERLRCEKENRDAIRAEAQARAARAAQRRAEGR